MAAPAEWTIAEYERVRGDFPVRTFLAGLDGDQADQAAALLLLLRARGNQLREPHSRIVEGQRNLLELRRHQVRIFYMFRPGREIVLLDGIVKKQDRIPTTDLKRALAYQRDVEQRGPRSP